MRTTKRIVAPGPKWCTILQLKATLIWKSGAATRFVWTILWGLLAFLPTVRTICELNTCETVHFYNTTTQHDTHAVVSVPLGHGVPQRKLKHIMGKQRSTTVGGTIGLAGGKPTASANASTSKSTSSTTEVADDEARVFTASYT